MPNLSQRTGWGYVPRFTDPRPPEFYDCGICGCYHPVNWDGDCRDDANRFSAGQLDDMYGWDGWQEVEMPA
jgi:hypothetical protein